MHKGLIVISKEDGIPEEFRKLALQHNSTVYGCAFLAETGIVYDTVHEDMSLKHLGKVLEITGKRHVVHYFGEFPEGFMKDDVQPFPIIGDKEAPTLVAAITGQFPSLGEDKSGHSEAFFVAKKLLVPKFQTAFDMIDGDLKKLIKYANQPIVKEELLALAPMEGSIVLMFKDGTILSYVKNASARIFPWGWVSESYGYEQGSKADEKPVESSAAGMLARLKGSTPSAASLMPARERKPPDGVHTLDAKGNMTSSKPASSAKGFAAVDAMAQPSAASLMPVRDEDNEDKDERGNKFPLDQFDPSLYRLEACSKGESKSKTKAWYRGKGGFLPFSYVECPLIPVLTKPDSGPKAGKFVHTDADLKVCVDAVREYTKNNGGAVGPVASTESPKANAGTKLTEALKDIKLPEAKDEPLVVVPKLERQAFAGTFMKQKHLDINSTPTIDPTTFASENDRNASFCEEAGLNALSDMFRLTEADTLDFVQTYPVLCTKLIRDLLRSHAEKLASKLQERQKKVA